MQELTKADCKRLAACVSRATESTVLYSFVGQRGQEEEASKSAESLPCHGDYCTALQSARSLSPKGHHRGRSINTPPGDGNEKKEEKHSAQHNLSFPIAEEEQHTGKYYNNPWG